MTQATVVIVMPPSTFFESTPYARVNAAGDKERRSEELLVIFQTPASPAIILSGRVHGKMAFVAAVAWYLFASCWVRPETIRACASGVANVYGGRPQLVDISLPKAVSRAYRLHYDMLRDLLNPRCRRPHVRRKILRPRCLYFEMHIFLGEQRAGREGILFAPAYLAPRVPAAS